ncbi:alpha/beta hydrolase fold domain-containing protein [Massilia aerilata]|uniref:Alpha/beta hydrolase fold domain-containing protein n=1 Tax=Massilia aerilata TaxID=453817 RepID=A0ABW0RVI1_9BURK
MRRTYAGLAAVLLLVSAGTAAQPPAPESYTAATTYKKLAPAYPFIRIAGSEAPASVRALTGITYVQRGGHALQLDLYLPAQPKAGPVPGIVFVHGGGWRAGVRANFAPMAIRMAERGYAAAAISYRLSPEALYPAAVQDARVAVRWMRTHAAEYGIDPSKIAIGGGSAGGHIAALAGVSGDAARFDPDGGPGTVSSAVQAIVNIDGLSDFTSEAARRYEDDPARQPSSAGAWFGGRYAAMPALWREASPLFYVNAKTPPVLFIGSAQPRFSSGREEMVARMREVGVPSRVVLLPETPHSFWLFEPWIGPTVEATVAFLDAYLR